MVAALAILGSASLAAAHFKSWSAEEFIPGAVGQDSAAAAATYHDLGEDEHFVYVTGYASTPLGGRVFATHKYFAEPQNPQKVSTVYYPLNPAVVSTVHASVAIAVNPDNGDVYVAGTSRSTTGGRTDTDIVIIKYDDTLAQVWEQRVGTLGNERAVAIVLDSNRPDPADHRVYVTGTSDGFGTMEDILTVNLQATSGVLSGNWPSLGTPGNGTGMRRYNNPLHNGSDRAADMAYSIPVIDSFAHLYIVGTSWQGTRGDDIFVIAYSDIGDVFSEWPQFFDVALGNDTGVAIAREDEGTGQFTSPVYIAGTVERSSGPPSSSGSRSGAPLSGSSAGVPGTDYATIAYTNNGIPFWAQFHDGPGTTFDDDVAVDIVRYGSSNQYIATTGNIRNGPLYDIETVRYSLEGTLLGTDRFGNVVFDEHVTAMADSDAGTFLIGWIDYALLDLPPVSYITVKYSGTWGTPAWHVFYPGNGLTDNKAFALAVGTSGPTQDVFVSGFSQRVTTGEDNVTIRYVDNP